MERAKANKQIIRIMLLIALFFWRINPPSKSYIYAVPIIGGVSSEHIINAMKIPTQHTITVNNDFIII